VLSYHGGRRWQGRTERALVCRPIDGFVGRQEEGQDDYRYADKDEGTLCQDGLQKTESLKLVADRARWDNVARVVTSHDRYSRSTGIAGR
jgi:hypothetical protein